MASPARRLAFRILLDVTRGGMTLAEMLATPEADALSPRDRSLLHELVLGTLRHQGLLDHALRPLTDRPLDGLDAPVLATLRLGAYQILRMRIPDRAAVSESVDVVRSVFPQGAGFVNAVLRRLSREGPPPVPDPATDPVGWLSTGGSLPAWLAERWVARLGAATAVARARAFLEVPPASFRLNPRVPDAFEQVRQAGLEPRPLQVPEAWEATAGRPGDLAAGGVLYLQDQGSQLIARLAARPGIVLDACAAPGGKSILVADLIAGRGTVVAGEAAATRLRSLAAVTRRWGSPNLALVRADALRPPFQGAFDAVLLDAPCTGLGTLGRHPDIRWKLSAAEIVRHSLRQRALLEALAPRVKAGGILVYATCSTEPEETEEPVGAFLEAHPEIALGPLPEWASPFAEGSFAATRPERDKGDAFFAAVLVRR